MGLNSGDQEKVPTNLTARDCYKRIWDWHRENGETFAPLRLLHESLQIYLSILPELPTEYDATEEDVAFLFTEVLTGTFEWSYHEEDGNGIKMAAYANHGVGKEYGDDMAVIWELAAQSVLSRLKS